MAVIMVETFEVREDGQLADDEENREAVDIAKSLGLEEQVRVRDDLRLTSRIPYEELGPVRSCILAMLAPQPTPLKSYKCIVPARVLVAAKQAVATDMLGELTVRHANYSRLLDPVAIGESFLTAKETTKDNKGMWHLVARWGLSLSPWEELKKLAHAEYVRRFSEAVEDVKAKATGDLASVEDYASKYFSGELKNYNGGLPGYSQPW